MKTSVASALFSAMLIAACGGSGGDDTATADAGISPAFDAADSPADAAVEGTIEVTSPTTKDIWFYETTADITWTTSGPVGNVNVELWKGGALLETIASDVAGTSATYDVTDALDPGDDYSVRVVDAADAAIFDDSDVNFSIGREAPFVMEVTPAGELPGTTVSVTGRAFNAGMEVLFNGEVITTENFVDADVDTFDFVLPELAPGDIDLQINFDGESATEVYTMGPTVTAMAPNDALPGATVTVSGTGFRPGTTTPVAGNFVDYSVRAGAAGAEFVDISVTGTNLAAGDDTVTLFAAAFEGNDLWPAGDVDVDSNGNVRVPGSNGASDFSNDVLPTAGNAGPQLIAPFWDDLAPQVGIGVFAEVLTVDGAPGTLVVSWVQAPQFNGAADGYTFQLQLFSERPVSATENVVARFVYLDVVNAAPNDNGASATIGYQNNQSPDGFDEFSSNAATVVDGDVIDLVAAFDQSFLVNFGDTSLTGTVIDSLTATVVMPIVPTLPIGAVDVSVSNPDGRLSANTFAYSVGEVVDPLVVAIDPQGELPGVEVTVTGFAFDPAMTATFNAAAITIENLVSDGELDTFTFALPDLAATDYELVIDLGGVASTPFVYTMGPTVTAFTPNQELAGSVITVNGTGFEDGLSVDFAGTPVVATFIDRITATVIVPALMAGTYAVGIINPGPRDSANTVDFEVLPTP